MAIALLKVERVIFVDVCSRALLSSSPSCSSPFSAMTSCSRSYSDKCSVWGWRRISIHSAAHTQIPYTAHCSLVLHERFTLSTSTLIAPIPVKYFTISSNNLRDKAFRMDGRSLLTESLIKWMKYATAKDFRYSFTLTESLYSIVSSMCVVALKGRYDNLVEWLNDRGCVRRQLRWLRCLDKSAEQLRYQTNSESKILLIFMHEAVLQPVNK
jgi:hypothetical protein